MDFLTRYPGVMDLKTRAQARLPRFVWEYLDSGTGLEATKARNRAGLDRVGFAPSILHGPVAPDLTTRFLGQTFPLPFGIAPVGMSGLIWPDAEGHLARAAARAGLTQPPKLTPRLMTQVAARPAWAWATARAGLPRMRTLDKYTSGALRTLPPTAHIGYLLRTSPDMDYVRWLRDAWEGPFIVKGVMRAEDCARLEEVGVDALWVSNHAGRQFDGARATVEVLPEIRVETRLPLIFDSGVESGLDILRALALGADFVMLGRAFHFALAALGADGPAHLIDILARDLTANMGQLGAHDLDGLPAPLDLPRLLGQD